MEVVRAVTQLDRFVPYGLHDGEQGTWDTAISFMRIGRERRTKETNTKIQRCLDALNILEQDQESITHEFSEMHRCTHSILKDTGWDDNFFDLLCTLRERPLSGRLNNCANFT